MLAYGRPTTITHRPKLSLKFNPSLSLPPRKINQFLMTLSLIYV